MTFFYFGNYFFILLSPTCIADLFIEFGLVSYLDRTLFRQAKPVKSKSLEVFKLLPDKILSNVALCKLCGNSLS
jgi:hypothetical protein